jgi:acyl-CoA thioester hydrolase
MAKPDAWRLDPAAYPFGCLTETRFQDLDPLGHINNVAMAGLFENGRIRFNRSLDMSWEMRPGQRWLIASVSIDYVAEAHFPAPVEVRVGIGRIGMRSWTMFSAAFQDGRCVATSDAVLVLAGADGALPVDAELRAVFETSMVTAP